MSEPQNKPVDELMKPATPTTAEQVSQEEQVPITLPSSDSPAEHAATPTTTTTTDNNNTNTRELSGDVKTLKDAFPDLDVDVIETILASQGGNLDAAFEVLLGMSDPSYKPEPGQSEGMNQLRQDEEYARRLAREGDAHYPQNNTQQQAEQPLFNFQGKKRGGGEIRKFFSNATYIRGIAYYQGKSDWSWYRWVHSATRRCLILWTDE